MPIVLRTSNFTIRNNICDCIVNRFANTEEIPAYLLIRKANESNTSFTQTGCPIDIIPAHIFLKMLTAVNFNSKLQRSLIEIHNEFSNRLLTAKMICTF